ncbi:MAG: HlyC/CorC family transporter [Lachnospiraceae bacterium]|nr:HlyC/CorC family transporter [Lachnospiraceae bacterium]
MDPDVIGRLIILVILLLLSSFFSSAETAFMSLNKLRVRSDAEEGSSRAKLILSLLENSNKLLTTVLIGNNLVNIAASALTTTLMIDLFGSKAVGIATGLLTLIILIFGEITPKTLASQKAERVAYVYAPFINLLMTVLTPVTFLVNFLAHGVLKLFSVDVNDRTAQQVTEDELLTLVDVSNEEGVLESDECEMINNVVDFGDTVAKDVMVPAINMTCVPDDISYEDLLSVIRSEAYSRMPVYKDTKDNIIGIIWAKDLVIKYDGKKPFKITDYMRKPYFTYEQKTTRELMTDMRKEYTTLAIVLDEYGATAGLITLEDLLEEIVGEIRDEYDMDEVDEISKISDTIYEVKGQTKLEDIKETVGIDIASDDYDSIAGHVIHLLGHIPSEGESVTENNVEYTVTSVIKNRIGKIRITLIPVV